VGAGGAGGAGGEGGSGEAGAAGAPIPQIFADIAVDANRDGLVNPDDPQDQDAEDEWTDKHGASFLANIDDDDDDGVRDVDDDIVNGPEDEADLARALLKASPDAPDGATGLFTVDERAAKNVRIWKRAEDGSWVPFAGSVGVCKGASDCDFIQEAAATTEELRAGLELAIEGRSFRLSLAESAWAGSVQMTWSLFDVEGNPLATEGNPEAADKATMRVAPWVLFGNLDAFDHVKSDSVYSPLVKGVKTAAQKAGIKPTTYKNWNDRWTQDFYQTGWTTIPAPDGAIHGMRIGNARPWGRENGDQYLPYTWLQKNYLAPDKGILKVYKKANTGDTFDSHGNHDLIPPYTNGDEKYPLGRILIGSAILKETKDFYNAQQVQGPYLPVKTSWLVVGHIDEVASFVPAQTPRGWKMLIASNTRARNMFEQLEKEGFGEQPMFVGKKFYNDKDALVDAEISVSETLKRADIMQWSQEAQVEIDDIRETIQEAVGLSDDEIIEVPFLTEAIGKGKVAWQPGTVNALVMGDHIAMADPFGPVIEGADHFKKDLEERLGTAMNKLGSEGQGLVVHWVDDWTGYHINLGEVHCATNPEGPPPAKLWWTVVR
jgi:protein-arginine deiminase